MTITDPISDMITTLRNAIAVRKERIIVPYSKVREAIAQLLKAEGYLTDAKMIAPVAGNKFSQLQLDIKYRPTGQAVIQGVRRVSRPGQHIYSSTHHLHKVLGGVGISVVSTSRGLMTDQQARTAGLGGEVLFKIW